MLDYFEWFKNETRPLTFYNIYYDNFESKFNHGYLQTDFPFCCSQTIESFEIILICISSYTKTYTRTPNFHSTEQKLV